MAACINLRDRFGDRYRIAFEPCYRHKGVPREKLDPCMMVIPCRAGEIYPHGGDQLVVEINGHRRIRGKLSRLSCCRLHQDGDDCGSFLFDVADFDEVAAIVKPYRRPRLSPQQRAAARERMKCIRQAQKKSGIKRPGIESETVA